MSVIFYTRTSWISEQ